MAEKLSHRKERIKPGPSGPGDIFSANVDDVVTVCHGPYSEQLPVGGMTVEVIRRRIGDRLDIDPASQAVLDGNEVDENTVVKTGQLLTFVRKAGEKGS
jgi:hypothetical protein